MKEFICLVLIAFTFYACPAEDDTGTPCVAELDPSCFCTMEYDPVCGCDDITYGNPCMAECSNITDYTPGECP